MCLACILRKSGLDYHTFENRMTQSRRSPTKKQSHVFYVNLYHFLTTYGPHFQQELLEQLLNLIPPKTRDSVEESNEAQSNILSYFNPLLNLRKLKEHKILTENILSKRFERRLRACIQDNFNTYTFVGAPLQYDPLYYTTQSSFNYFIQKAYKGTATEAIFKLMQIPDREKKHSFKI